MAVLSDLRIVVSDSTTQQLRFFSPAGVHERTVGGRGSGPGEYRALGGIDVTAGDTLLIPDRLTLRLNRVAIYPNEGSDQGDIQQIGGLKQGVGWRRCE